MAYLLYYFILLPLSFLPLRVLYLLGDLMSTFNWHVVGYRKSVVLDNIEKSFPKYTPSQVIKLARQYYSFFFSTIAESIKQFSLSERAAVRRCSVLNPEAIAHLLEQGRSVIAYGAHYGNWEMAALSFPSHFPNARVMGIYSPLKNETLNRLFTKNRGRTGTYLVSRRKVDEYFDAPASGRPAVDFFIADQSPSNAIVEKLHWTTFLGRTTAFLAGPERYAVRNDRPVYYMTLRRQSDGHYTAKLVPITDHPRETAPGYITEAFARRLEQEILRDPTTWLWSHKRWKRAVPEGVEALVREEGFTAPDY